MLLQSYGLTFLIDPIFSERVSPLSFVGPKRPQPPIDLADAMKQAQLPEDAFRALAIGETLVVPLGHSR